MNTDCKIALLWLIREHKPITLEEVASLLEKTPSVLPATVQRELLQNLTYHPKHAVEDLLKAGLIQVENGDESDISARFVTDPKLPIIQNLFDISLTESLNAPGKFTRAYPVFGKPSEKSRNQTWSQIFVAMPFRDDMRPIYSDHILKVADEIGVTCKRGDDIFSTNSIIQDIWSAIFHAELCVVDCSYRNPNVFYELGIAHTLGRPTILITQSMDDIPFDIHHIRTIPYENTPTGMAKFESALRQTILAELNRRKRNL